MTREERILEELNKAEQRLKRAYETGKGNTEDTKKIEGWMSGAHQMLVMLGYSAITDDDKDEWVEGADGNGTWIYTYKGIRDFREW